MFSHLLFSFPLCDKGIWCPENTTVQSVLCDVFILYSDLAIWETISESLYLFSNLYGIHLFDTRRVPWPTAQIAGPENSLQLQWISNWRLLKFQGLFRASAWLAKGLFYCHSLVVLAIFTRLPNRWGSESLALVVKKLEAYLTFKSQTRLFPKRGLLSIHVMLVGPSSPLANPMLWGHGILSPILHRKEKRYQNHK